MSCDETDSAVSPRPLRHTNLISLFLQTPMTTVVLEINHRVIGTTGTKFIYFGEHEYRDLLFGQIFLENCMKMKEIGPRGGPLDPYAR